MGTACWGTNESFDCEWISFGYGSRNDMSMLWLSLEAYLALSRLDDLPMSNYCNGIPHDEFLKFSPFRAYTFSSDRFCYADTDKALSWFEQARSVRQYYINNPERTEEKIKDESIRKRVYEMYLLSDGYTVAYPSRNTWNSILTVDYDDLIRHLDDEQDYDLSQDPELDQTVLVSGVDWDYFPRLKSLEWEKINNWKG